MDWSGGVEEINQNIMPMRHARVVSSQAPFNGWDYCSEARPQIQGYVIYPSQVTSMLSITVSCPVWALAVVPLKRDERSLEDP